MFVRKGDEDDSSSETRPKNMRPSVVDTCSGAKLVDQKKDEQPEDSQEPSIGTLPTTSNFSTTFAHKISAFGLYVFSSCSTSPLQISGK